MEEIVRNVGMTVLAAAVTGFFGAAFVKKSLFLQFFNYVFYPSAFVCFVAFGAALSGAQGASSVVKGFGELRRAEGVVIPSAVLEKFNASVDSVFAVAHDVLLLAYALAAVAVITGLLYIYVAISGGRVDT